MPPTLFGWSRKPGPSLDLSSVSMATELDERAGAPVNFDRNDDGGAARSLGGGRRARRAVVGYRARASFLTACEPGVDCGVDPGQLAPLTSGSAHQARAAREAHSSGELAGSEAASASRKRSFRLRACRSAATSSLSRAFWRAAFLRASWRRLRRKARAQRACTSATKIRNRGSDGISSSASRPSDHGVCSTQRQAS